MRLAPTATVVVVTLAFFAAGQRTAAQTKNIFKDAGPARPSGAATAGKTTPAAPPHPLAAAVDEVNTRALRLAADMPATGNPLAAPLGFWRASSLVKAITDLAAAPPPLMKPFDQFVTSTGPDAPDAAGQLRGSTVVWTTTGGTINPELAQRTRDRWGVVARPLDLANRATATRELDDWIVQNTSGELAKTVQATLLLGSPPAVITDAVRFEAPWQQPFDKAQTQDAPFTAADGSTIQLPMMRLTSNLPYLKNDDVELVVIPFTIPQARADVKPAAYALAVLLPPVGQPIKPMAAGITPEKWKAWLDEAIITDAEMKAWEDTAPTSTLVSDNEAWMNTYPLKALAVALPRFTARSPQAVDASWQAQAAGPAALFVQGVVVSVGEAGIGETAEPALVGPSGGVVGEPIPFDANRPFLFAVVEQATGAIVLVGQVNGVK
jgi:serpin B